MEEFDSVSVTKTINSLYSSLFSSIVLLSPSASTRYYTCIELDNGHDYEKSCAESYKFHFMKQWESRKQIDEAISKPWIHEIVNRAIAYRSKSPGKKSTFLQEAQVRLLEFEGLYRRLWENTDLPESIRPKKEKVNEDRKIWREFDRDRNFDALIVGLRDELAAIMRTIVEQKSEIVGLKKDARSEYLIVANELLNRVKSNPSWWKSDGQLVGQLESLRKKLIPGIKHGFILLNETRINEMSALSLRKQIELHKLEDLGFVTRDAVGDVYHFPRDPETGRDLTTDQFSRTTLLCVDPWSGYSSMNLVEFSTNTEVENLGVALGLESVLMPQGRQRQFDGRDDAVNCLEAWIRYIKAHFPVPIGPSPRSISLSDEAVDAATAPWLSKAFTTLMEIKKQSISVSRDERFAAILLRAIGLCDRWFEISEEIIHRRIQQGHDVERSGWLEHGVNAKLECVSAIIEVAKRLRKGASLDEGFEAFDFASIDSLFAMTLTRLRDLGVIANKEWLHVLKSIDAAETQRFSAETVDFDNHIASGRGTIQIGSTNQSAVTQEELDTTDNGWRNAVRALATRLFPDLKYPHNLEGPITAEPVPYSEGEREELFRLQTLYFEEVRKRWKELLPDFEYPATLHRGSFYPLFKQCGLLKLSEKYDPTWEELGRDVLGCVPALKSSILARSQSKVAISKEDQSLDSSNNKQSKSKKKRAEQGELDSYELFRGEILRHHAFGKENLLTTPTSPSELVEKLGMSKSTWTRCFKDWVGSHAKYKRLCNDVNLGPLQKNLERLHGSLSEQKLIQSAAELVSSDESRFSVS